MSHLVKIIIGILIVVCLSLKELLQVKARAKIMFIYFTIIGIALLLSILINIERAPESPFAILLNSMKILENK